MRIPVLVVAIVIVVLAAVFTNPSVDRHREAMQLEVKRQAADAGPLGELAGAVVGTLSSFVIDYRDYKIFSTGNIDGKTQTVGVLGMVFYVGDTLKERRREG